MLGIHFTTCQFHLDVDNTVLLAKMDLFATVSNFKSYLKNQPRLVYIKEESTFGEFPSLKKKREREKMADSKGGRWKIGRHLSAVKLALKTFNGLQGGEHAVQVWL